MDTTEHQLGALSELIGAELASGRISFPTFLEASLRIKALADDPHSSLRDIAQLVKAEPLLSARVIRMANSALLNPGGKVIASTDQAVVRIGLLPVRTLAFVVAAQQLESDLRSETLKVLSSALWLHSVDVATRAYVLAGRFRICSPDKAMLVGMLRNVGEFYLIARVATFPELASQTEKLSEFVLAWRNAVGGALLEVFELPAEIVGSVDPATCPRPTWPPQDIAELLQVCVASAESPNPFDRATATPGDFTVQAAEEAGDASMRRELFDQAKELRKQLIAAICG